MKKEGECGRMCVQMIDEIIKGKDNTIKQKKRCFFSIRTYSYNSSIKNQLF